MMYEGYFYYGNNCELDKGDKVVNMLYRNYKKHYSDCKTVPGTYDADSKTIDVIIPEGRMKPSGVRGQRFHGYQFWMIDKNGDKKYSCYRAVSEENAYKRHVAFCKEIGATPIQEPIRVFI